MGQIISLRGVRRIFKRGDLGYRRRITLLDLWPVPLGLEELLDGCLLALDLYRIQPGEHSIKQQIYGLLCRY